MIEPSEGGRLSLVEGRPRITQVFISTVAGGGYGGEQALSAFFPDGCGLLLCAAYRGTLLAAASRRQRKCVLTLIGGGVFRNDRSTIWAAIKEALEHVQPRLARDLDVIINGRTLSHEFPADQILDMTRRWQGALVRLWPDGEATIVR